MFEIPIYLRALLGRFTSGGRAGTYDALITPIQERGLSVTFVTLNYDTLLDEAIGRKYETQIESMNDYVSDTIARPWSYIKLHGSVNWVYPTRMDSQDRMATNFNVDRYLSVMDRNHDHIRDSPSGILLTDNHSLKYESILTYPALAIPADARKAVVCPGPHIGALRSALDSDPSVLVIGNQGLDRDLMAILSKSTPRYSNKPFRVVDPKDATAVMQRFAEALNRTGYRMYPDVGFRDFVTSAEAERFFDEVREAKNAETANRFRR